VDAVRPERSDNNLQQVDADAVDAAGFSDLSEQSPRPCRLDARPGEHQQLGDEAVHDRQAL
jgi:hypothetical protein